MEEAAQFFEVGGVVIAFMVMALFIDMFFDGRGN